MQELVEGQEACLDFEAEHDDRSHSVHFSLGAILPQLKNQEVFQKIRN